MTPVNSPALRAESINASPANFGGQMAIGSWRWEVDPQWAGIEYRVWLASPETLLRPPAVIIERIPPNPTTQVARIQLPEHPARPLIVKYSTPRGAWQSLKDWFRPSRARR